MSETNYLTPAQFANWLEALNKLPHVVGAYIRPLDPYKLHGEFGVCALGALVYSLAETADGKPNLDRWYHQGIPTVYVQALLLCLPRGSANAIQMLNDGNGGRAPASVEEIMVYLIENRSALVKE